MPRGRPERAAVDAFFRGLRKDVLAAWSSRNGFAYDRVLYAVGYPYGPDDPARVLRFVGREDETKAVPPLAALNRVLLESRYPELGARSPPGLTAWAWSALAHFLDPSYPMATTSAWQALRMMGFDLPEEIAPRAYPAYLEAVDALKARAPVWAVPETNWYLSRVLEVGLSRYAPRAQGARGRAR